MGCCLERIRSFDGTPRLRHVLMFSFRPETTIDQEIDVMKALGSLPQILGGYGGFRSSQGLPESLANWIMVTPGMNRFWTLSSPLRIYPRVLASYVYPDLRLAGSAGLAPPVWGDDIDLDHQALHRWL